MTPTNKRMIALEGTAGQVARALTAGLGHDIEVVVSNKAAFDWKRRRLYLPGYAEDTGRHSDPRLADAWRGLSDHECAHVVHTDFEVAERYHARWEQEWGRGAVPRVHRLANVAEDLWIEPAWCRRYKGSIKHFEAKNSYLVETTGGAGPTNPLHVPEGGRKPIGVFGAFSQAVLRVGRGGVTMAQVHPATRQLMQLCMPQVEQMWAAQSTEEACEAAEATWRRLLEISEPPPPEPEEEPEEGEEGSGSGGESEEGEEGEGEGEGEQEGEGSGSGEEGEEGEEESAAAPVSGADEEGEGGEGSEDAPGELTPGGTGHDSSINGVDQELAARAIGGAWGKMPTDGDVIASKYLRSAPPQYTVHPDTKKRDRVITYDAARRAEGRAKVKSLERAAGPAVQHLSSTLAEAVAAARQSLTIGEQEDGDGLDYGALSGIALGLNTSAVFTTTTQEVTESTFVAVLVDCSGSMRDSTPSVKPDGSLEVTTASGYAAITAMALHKAMRALQLPHAVLGYTTSAARLRRSETLPNGYLEWSRSTRALEHHVFVPAPGTNDDGSALAFITGRHWNVDGESVMWAAQYAAAQGGQYDRVILMVIADGLPAGADDKKVEGPYLRQVVDQVAHAGIEVYGVGVGIRNFSTFRSYYPDRREEPGRAPTGCMEIPNGKGLSASVIRKITDLLTRGYGRTRR